VPFSTLHSTFVSAGERARETESAQELLSINRQEESSARLELVLGIRTEGKPSKIGEKYATVLWTVGGRSEEDFQRRVRGGGRMRPAQPELAGGEGKKENLDIAARHPKYLKGEDVTIYLAGVFYLFTGRLRSFLSFNWRRPLSVKKGV